MVRRKRIQNHRGGEEQLRGAEKQKGVPEKSKSHVTSVMWFPGEGRRNRSLIRRQKKTALLPKGRARVPQDSGPAVGFRKTVSLPDWRVSSGTEVHSVALCCSEDNNQAPSLGEKLHFNSERLNRTITNQKA